MEREETLKIRNVKTVYTEIMKRIFDAEFSFPNGGQMDGRISKVIKNMTKMYGQCNENRIVDYCVFQLYRCRDSEYTKSLTLGMFGDTAFSKFERFGVKKRNSENQWLAEVGLSRDYLCSLIKKKEHPFAKFVYMPSEEMTKMRKINTDVGFFICAISTLMWSPYSKACSICSNAERCKKETEKRYPELYRIRIEKYGKK